MRKVGFWIAFVLLLGAVAQVSVKPAFDPGLIVDDEVKKAYPHLSEVPWDRVAYTLNLDRAYTLKLEWWSGGERINHDDKTFSAGPVVVATGYRAPASGGCTLYWSVTLWGKDDRAQRLGCLEVAPLQPLSPIIQGALPDELEPGKTYLLAWFRYADALERMSDLLVTLRLE
ncbi:hypothetical protein [Oceanithermus desulfurans]